MGTIFPENNEVYYGALSMQTNMFYITRFFKYVLVPSIYIASNKNKLAVNMLSTIYMYITRVIN